MANRAISDIREYSMDPRYVFAYLNYRHLTSDQ